MISEFSVINNETVTKYIISVQKASWHESTRIFPSNIKQINEYNQLQQDLNKARTPEQSCLQFTACSRAINERDILTFH